MEINIKEQRLLEEHFERWIGFLSLVRDFFKAHKRIIEPETESFTKFFHSLKGVKVRYSLWRNRFYGRHVCGDELGIIVEKEPMLAQEINDQDMNHFRMVDIIKQEMKATAPLTGIDELSSDLEQALLKVPRHQFVSKEFLKFSYFNEALPIGCGQTISQPFIVAVMTALIQPQKDHRVLEIGTGSGYQAAILGQLVKEVYTMEVIPELSLTAQRHFNECEYRNIFPLIGTGVGGWPEYAPYNGILVTAACEEVPQALVDQLSLNGRMVIPLGRQGERQMLTLITKDQEGYLHEKSILPVAFVPFT